MAETAQKSDARVSQLRIKSLEAGNSSAASIALEVKDSELVERMRRGDRWAKEAFYRKHVERAFRVARRLVRVECDAEDVVQEAFAQAFADLPKLRDPNLLKAWFLRIVVNRAHRKFRRRQVLLFLGWGPSPEQACMLVHEEAPPEVRVELSLVEQALEEVPVAARTAWVLRRVEGCSLAEVAEACDVSLATVKRRIAQLDEHVTAFVQASNGTSTKAGGDEDNPQKGEKDHD